MIAGNDILDAREPRDLLEFQRTMRAEYQPFGPIVVWEFRL
jgi:hypothetical protein